MNRVSGFQVGGVHRRRDDAQPGSPMRVLVVEDEFLQGLTVQNLIVEAGGGQLEPVLAPSLENAMERIVTQAFDVVLLDLMLPDAKGLAGLERIVQMAPRLPVVVLTGLGEEELVARAFDAGAQDYLVKGDGDAKELLRAIRHAVRRKASELRRLERARSDPLTGLANREVLVERIERAKGRADREQRPFALLFLDLDGFKAVNDTAGHAAGDRVLQAVARRLTAVLRRADTVARLGGDEFVLLAEALHASSDAAVIARKTLSSLMSPIVVDQRTFSVGGSIGISVYPDDARDPDRLIDLADSAMYRAKQAGRNRFAFVPLDDRQDLESVSSAPRRSSTDEIAEAQSGRRVMASRCAATGARSARGRGRGARRLAAIDNAMAPARRIRAMLHRSRHRAGPLVNADLLTRVSGAEALVETRCRHSRVRDATPCGAGFANAKIVDFSRKLASFRPKNILTPTPASAARQKLLQAASGSGAGSADLGSLRSCRAGAGRLPGRARAGRGWRRG